MITIISGTNRKGSKTLVIAKHYLKVFQDKTEEEVKLLSLEDVSAEMLHQEMYEEGGQSAALAAIQDEYLLKADKYFFISPEYNGSFPGILKLLIDAVSIRQYKQTFKGKKAALAGVASGRAGNLRGMDHLCDVLNHVGTEVMANKLPISSIGNIMKDDEITDEGTLVAIEWQVKGFLEF